VSSAVIVVFFGIAWRIKNLREKPVDFMPTRITHPVKRPKLITQPMMKITLWLSRSKLEKVNQYRRPN